MPKFKPDLALRKSLLIEDNKVIGDLWYATLLDLPRNSIPDIDWLGIDLSNNSVYLFDMYVHPEKRGALSTNLLLGGALYTLRGRGFIEAYGYYESDNLPALWVHRLFGYKEIQKLQMQKYFFIIRKVVNA